MQELTITEPTCLEICDDNGERLARLFVEDAQNATLIDYMGDEPIESVVYNWSHLGDELFLVTSNGYYSF